MVEVRTSRVTHGPADIDDRRAAQPWYRAKTEPAFEDMLIKPTSQQIHAVLLAWDAAAA